MMIWKLTYINASNKTITDNFATLEKLHKWVSIDKITYYTITQGVM